MPSIVLQQSINLPMLFQSGVTPTDPLVNGLLAYYSFDGNVLDISNQGNDYINADTSYGLPALFGSGIHNQATKNNPAKLGTYITSTSFIDPSQPVSYSTWVKVSSFSTTNNLSNYYNLIGGSQYNPGIGYSEIGASDPVNGTNRDRRIFACTPQIASPAAAYYSNPVPVQSGGSFYHVVLRLDNANGKLKLSVNGVSQPDATFPANSITPDYSNVDPLILWDPSYMPNNVPAYVDETGVWNRLLTDAEITTLYNGGTGKFYNAATNSFQ